MELSKREALSKCMAICSKAEKCTSDIQQKLKGWNVSDDDIQSIIDQLIEEKFIDEERYVSYYVKDKFRFNNWGKVKIAYMLKAKRIANSIVQDALQGISDEDYFEKLQDILIQKRKSVKAPSEYEKKMKLIRFAQGRGFELDAINKVLSML